MNPRSHSSMRPDSRLLPDIQSMRDARDSHHSKHPPRRSRFKSGPLGVWRGVHPTDRGFNFPFMDMVLRENSRRRRSSAYAAAVVISMCGVFGDATVSLLRSMEVRLGIDIVTGKRHTWPGPGLFFLDRGATRYKPSYSNIINLATNLSYSERRCSDVADHQSSH
jgi:hypothetical protein